MSPRPAALPLHQQIDELEARIGANPALVQVLERARSLELPGWYLTAGCVVQTVWNGLTGRDADAGIKDYDLFYFDDSDLSWDAEDAVIGKGAECFAGLPAEVEIRNEARVHLWYEQKFGSPAPHYTCTEDAIASFPATTCSVGIRSEADGRLLVYAPYGLADVFDLVVRPNLRFANERSYVDKTTRWSKEWPELTVLPWP